MEPLILKKFRVLQGIIQIIEHSEFYLAVDVPASEVDCYLKLMQQILPASDFDTYLSNQQTRDEQKYHITVINPIEYNAESHCELVGNMVTYSLIGLGRVTHDGEDVFFIVAESLDIENLRQQLQLPARDFHVTLGFKNNDIHDVTKDRSTLLCELRVE